MNETSGIPEIVKITYKTGDYVGEAFERDDRRVLVKVLAVLQHPTQGDLHSSYDQGCWLPEVASSLPAAAKETCWPWILERAGCFGNFKPALTSTLRR